MQKLIFLYGNMIEVMKNRPNSLEPVPDTLKIEVDIGTYEEDKRVERVRQRKKRNSVIVVNLKKQLKQDSRFISLLCSKTVKPVAASVDVPKNKNVLSIPGMEFSSEDSCVTPFQNTLLRTIPTPVSVSIGKYPSQVSSKKASVRITHKSLSGSPGRFLLKPKPKRVFKSIHNPEPSIRLFPSKLKKRSLNSETSAFRLFDQREIFNITYGSFVFK